MSETMPDSPSSPSDYAGVAVSHFDIQAAQQDLTATLATAVGDAMDRQVQASSSVLDTPAGAGEMQLLAGTSPDWPTDVRP